MDTAKESPASTPPAAKSMTIMAWGELCKHRPALISIVVILIFLGIAIFADVIAKTLEIDPSSQDIINRFGEWDKDHWMGTDELGRDVFIRLVYGTRISLTVAIVVAFSSTFLGITIGAMAGYFGGMVDTVLMRLTDSLLSLPTIPVLILVASVDPTKVPVLASMDPESMSILKMILVLMLFSWMGQARLVRGEVLAIKEQEYILAARTSGMSHIGIILKEILPNVITPVIVSVTLGIGSSILFEAALSFLGLGIQPPTPSWGNMLNNAQEIIYSAPLLAVIPGILILIVTMSFNFLGDGLQDALDPKAMRR
jgi:peptide/nickel transport system permease protein